MLLVCRPTIRQRSWTWSEGVWGRAGTREAPVSVCPSVKLRRTSEALMAAVSLPAPNFHANSCLSHPGPEPCRRARWEIQFLV